MNISLTRVWPSTALVKGSVECRVNGSGQGIHMKGICCWMVAALAFAATFSAFALVDSPNTYDSKDVPARISAVGDPVAVIAPLPDYVSNGSWYDLDGTGSYDTDGGLIKDWSWEIALGTAVEISHASLHRYMFKELGLYKITLTVTDSQNQSNRSFTAVVSVLDKDGDNMPDWWELNYMGTVNETGSGDFDRDEYTNLEEYARGTDPSVKDPQPNLIDEMRSHWYVFAAIAAVIICIALAMWPILRRRRKVVEKKKIEAAIAIEKALEQDELE